MHMHCLFIIKSLQIIYENIIYLFTNTSIFIPFHAMSYHSDIHIHNIYVYTYTYILCMYIQYICICIYIYNKQSIYCLMSPNHIFYTSSCIVIHDYTKIKLK